MKKGLHDRQIARQAMMKAEQEQLKCHRQDVLGGRQIEEYYPSDGYLELLRAEARRAFGDWWTEMSGHGAWRELPEFALRWCAVQACLAILRLDIHSTKALRFVVEHT